MPPKKAAAGATATRRSSRATKETQAATDDASKATTQSTTKAMQNASKSATKAAAKEKTSPSATKDAKKETTTKASTKAAKAPAKEPAKKSNKRKAEDDVEEPQVNGNKKTRTTRTKEPAKKSTKQTAEEDEEVKVNGTKRARTQSTTPESEDEVHTKTKAPSRTRRTAAPRAPAAKKARKIVVINEAPTQKLNVYVFGDGTNGELGLGNGKNCAEVKRPRLNPHLAADTVGVVSVSVGGMHTAVLTKDSKILTWGVNDQGALGRNTEWEGGLRDIADDKSDDDSDDDSDTGSGLNPKESTPGEVDLSAVPDGTIFTQIACSDSATFALTNDGLVYGCGTFRSNEGIFGFTEDSLIQRNLIQIPTLKKVKQLAAGANHVLALDATGIVYAWGSGQQNQLGRRIVERNVKHSLRPTPFGLPKQMVAVGAGAYHSFAMHKNGKLYSWGLNSFGETGITKNFEAEGESDVHHATIVPNLDDFGAITQVEGGSHHTIALTDRGEVLVWGRLDGYQLGLHIKSIPDEKIIKDSHDHPRILKVPTRVPGIDGAAIAAGSDHSIAIAKDGKAYAWGFSTSYQTGLGTDEEVEVATHIDNTAVRGKQLVWAGAGGQFSVVAGLAGVENAVANGEGVNGYA